MKGQKLSFDFWRSQFRLVLESWNRMSQIIDHKCFRCGSEIQPPWTTQRAWLMSMLNRSISWKQCGLQNHMLAMHLHHNKVIQHSAASHLLPSIVWNLHAQHWMAALPAIWLRYSLSKRPFPVLYGLARWERRCHSQRDELQIKWVLLFDLRTPLCLCFGWSQTQSMHGACMCPFLFQAKCRSRRSTLGHYRNH